MTSDGRVRWFQRRHAQKGSVAAATRLRDDSNALITSIARPTNEIASNGLVGGIGVYSTGIGQPLLMRGDASALEVLLDPLVDTTVLAFPNALSQLGINRTGRIIYCAYQDSGVSTSGYAIFVIDSAGHPVDPVQSNNTVTLQFQRPR